MMTASTAAIPLTGRKKDKRERTIQTLPGRESKINLPKERAIPRWSEVRLPPV